MKVTLKELRARANITQSQMAEKLGINTTTYNAWETLCMDDVKKIAEMFKIKASDIDIPRK